MFCSLDILEGVKWDKVLLNLDEEGDVWGADSPVYNVVNVNLFDPFFVEKAIQCLKRGES